jgi:Acetoacetate decarboxylase (ADC)
MIDYITDAEAAAVLPAEASLIAIPNAPGQSAVKFAWAHYRRCTLGPYREVFQAIPCLYDNNLYLYVPGIWVDTDAAMASGREVAGFPKKLADIEINFLGNTWQGYLDRPRGQRLASSTFETTDELLSIPCRRIVLRRSPNRTTSPAAPGADRPTASAAVQHDDDALDPEPQCGQPMGADAAQWHGVDPGDGDAVGGRRDAGLPCVGAGSGGQPAGERNPGRDVVPG